MAADVALVRYDAACLAIAEARAVDEVKQIIDATAALRAYARQAKNKTLEADAWEIRMRAERRVGEMMQAQRETVGLAKGGASELRAGPDGTRSYRCLACRQLYSDPPGHICKESAPTLAEAGIDKHLADRARKLVRQEAEEFEDAIAEGRARIQSEVERVRVDLVAKTAHVSQNSGENEWYTPALILDAAREAMGGIDTDPASSNVANRTVKAAGFYTAEDDGLTRKWSGNVWMNPPYAQPLVSQFADAVSDKYDAKEIKRACVLVNNATETAWFQRMLASASAVCFLKGRVKFLDTSGEASGAPLQGQAVLYLGENQYRFARAFNKLGPVLFQGETK